MGGGTRGAKQRRRHESLEKGGKNFLQRCVLCVEFGGKGGGKPETPREICSTLHEAVSMSCQRNFPAGKEVEEKEGGGSFGGDGNLKDRPRQSRGSSCSRKQRKGESDEKKDGGR